MPIKSKQKIKQEIVIVIDKSGSMSNCREDVIGGFNTYVSDLKQDEDVEIKLSMIMFDNQVHQLYTGKKIEDVDNLTNMTYCPNGGTALNDALMLAIEDVEGRLSKSKSKNKPQVMVIVFTDGEENASRVHTDLNKIKQTRSDKEQDGWAFIFMGADMDAWAASGSYGMSAGNTVSLGKQAIQSSASFLRNRTAKAARLYDSSLSGQISAQAYATSMQNLMSIDEDDLQNDQEAVALRATIDNSVTTVPIPPVNQKDLDTIIKNPGLLQNQVFDGWSLSPETPEHKKLRATWQEQISEQIKSD